MSDDGRDPFAIPKDMRAMAEASFDQARKAFDKFMESAKATAGTMEERRDTVRAGAREIGGKAVSYAEKNVQASLDYAQSLLKAKDLPEVMKLHSEYVQSQMRSLAEHVRPESSSITCTLGDPITKAPQPGFEGRVGSVSSTLQEMGR